MKKITEGVIESFNMSKRTLNDKNFRKLLLKELPRYDVTNEFIQRFNEYIDFDELSKLSLSKECIEYLCKEKKFNYDNWSKNNLTRKDLSILLNDEFIETYVVNPLDIILNSNNVTQEIFDKYKDSVVSDGLKRLVTIAINNKLDIPLDYVIDNMNTIGDRCLYINSVKEDVQKEDSKFIDAFFRGEERNIEVLLSLLYNYHMPSITAEKIESIPYADIQFTSEEVEMNQNQQGVSMLHTAMNSVFFNGYTEDQSERIARLRRYVNGIMQSYQDDVVETILKNVYYYGKEALLSKDLLGCYLLDNDNISEECLTVIAECYVLVGLRDDLITYGKNHGYQTLLVALNLGNISF